MADELAVGVTGTHDAHVELVREIDVRRVAAAPGDERQVLQPFDCLPDELCLHSRARISFAAARTALTMFL